MRTNRHKKFKATKRQAVVLVLSVCFIAGVWFGAATAFTVNDDSYSSMSRDLGEYLRSFKDISASPTEIFRESVVKYGKFFMILWLLAFLPSANAVPIGGFAATVLITVRGVSYGFATATLIRIYGPAGSVCAAILYLPQSIILIPMYIFTAYSCVQFILRNTGKEKSGLREYALVLILGFAITAAAGFIDVFIVPGLVNNFL